MSGWVRLCSETELPADGKAKEFSVHGLTLCVAKLRGKPFALDNVCPHRGGPLAEGTIEHGKVVCPWHQWEFNLITGVSTHSQSAKVATYELQLQGSEVMVKI